MNKKFFKNSKEFSIAQDILSILIALASLVYLAIGFFAKIWHPTWLIFVGTAVVALVVYFICGKMYSAKLIESDKVMTFDKQYETSQSYAKCVKISGMLFIITSICYVIICSFIGMWHPLWLMFVLMSVIEQVIALVFKIRYKDYSRAEATQKEVAKDIK